MKVFDNTENKEITAFEFIPNPQIDDSMFEIPQDVDVHSIYDSK